jgi:hypothetical protein
MITFMLHLCLLTSSLNAAPEAELRGYTQVTQILKERLFQADSDFELSQFIGDAAELGNLMDLLGTYKNGFTAGGRFRNGAPNPLNTLIWHLMFYGLAEQAASLCHSQTSLGFNDHFRQSLAPFCEAEFSPTEEELSQFWLAVMSFDAPATEYFEWRDYWLANQDFQGSTRILWMMISILEHPHFLLRQ